MLWQDIIIAVCQIFFVIALFPSLATNSKPALLTSVMNMTLMGIISGTQFTLHLWFSSITAVVIGIGHMTLAIQKAKMNKAEKALNPSEV